MNKPDGVDGEIAREEDAALIAANAKTDKPTDETLNTTNNTSGAGEISS